MTDKKVTETNPYTSVSALQDIVEWSSSRPDWQRDALRQLIQSVDNEIDLDRLEAICAEERDDVTVLTEADITPQSTNGEPVTISKLDAVQGVNALAANQQLVMAEKGVTIVYGDNGSGKSGYCRVLKNACRSRDSKFAIHPNIDDAVDTPQSANIEYKLGDETETAPWTPDADQPAILSQVSIIDSRSANTHVQAENNVAYTPFPMRVLEALGDLCDALKERLETRIRQIEAKTPLAISNHQLAADTAAGKYLGGLSAKSDLTVLELLCEPKDEEKRRLETLRTDLSQDPKKVVSKLRAQRQRIGTIISAAQALNNVLTDEVISGFKSIKKAHEDAKEASKLASKELFDASPLPQIGSDTWKVLWEAARTFSDDIAYPEKQFPDATPGGDFCVLCQQPLSEEAVNRRATFESFVKSTTKVTEQECLTALETRLAELRQVLISDETQAAADTLLREELSMPEFADTLSVWVKAANDRLIGILEYKEIPEVAVDTPHEALSVLAKEFDDRIVEVQSVEDPEARAKLMLEKQELEDRIQLAGIRGDVEAQINRHKEIAALKKKVKSTARTSVTNKNKELSELLVTGALRSRFAREISKLDINAIPMELNKTRDRKAQSFFRVEFVGYPGQPLGEILSEGEHRCVALAAFLAELVTSRDYSGIVFDDPMSSLDHIYRERVAKRLAEEAQHRQVVIFTHDLGFLFEVIREAEALDVPLHYQHVKRRGNIPGYVSAELPMKAKTAPALVAALRAELKDLKGQLDTVSEARRALLTKGVIEQLREAWDQVIADFIAPVLGRFDNQIKGNSLFKLLILTQDDVDLIKSARSRLSEDLHNAAGALNPEEMSHDQLVEEVNVIHNFIEDMKKRPKQVEPRITGL